MGFLAVIAVFYGMGIAHYFYQNQPGRLGGPITVENALWLTYALAAWFVLPARVVFDRHAAPVLRRIYGIFLGGFVLRALAEAYLLLGPKAWIPPYGIGHDLVTIVGVALLMVVWRRELVALVRSTDQVFRGFLVVTMLALAAEATFAWLFFVAVDFRTHFLWYADYTPRFALLNAMMLTAVVAVHVDLAIRLVKLYAPHRLPSWLAPRG